MQRRFQPFPLLFLTVLLDMVGFGIVVPLLPFYAEHFGGTGFEVGLTLALPPLGMLIASPLWGRYSDRVGRRPALLISMLGNTLAYIWLAFVGSLGALFAARFFSGLMTGHMTAIQAYVADITPPEQRTARMGSLGIAFGLGFIIGPALGGVASHFGFAAPGLVAAGLLAVASILIYFFIPEPARHQHRPDAEQTLSAIFHTNLLKLFAVGLLGMLAFSGMQSTFALLVEKNFYYGPREVGYLMTYIGVVVIIYRVLFLNWLLRLLGEKWLLIGGLIFIALGLYLLPLAPDLRLLLLFMLAFPLGMGSFNPSLLSLVSHEAPESRRGLVLGVNNTVFGIGQVAGPLIIGALFDLYDPAFAFTAAAVVALLGAFVALFYRAPDKAKSAS